MYFDANTLSVKGSFKETKMQKHMIKRGAGDPEYGELKTPLERARFVMEHIGWEPQFADELFDLWQNKKLVGAEDVATLKGELERHNNAEREEEAKAMAELCGGMPVAEDEAEAPVKPKRRGRKAKEA